MDVESAQTINDAVDRAVKGFRDVLESFTASAFENLNLFARSLDGTIVQSDPITVSIPKLTIWLKLPKEKENA